MSSDEPSNMASTPTSTFSASSPTSYSIDEGYSIATTAQRHSQPSQIFLDPTAHGSTTLTMSTSTYPTETRLEVDDSNDFNDDIHILSMFNYSLPLPYYHSDYLSTVSMVSRHTESVPRVFTYRSTARGDIRTRDGRRSRSMSHRQWGEKFHPGRDDTKDKLEKLVEEVQSQDDSISSPTQQSRSLPAAYLPSATARLHSTSSADRTPLQLPVLEVDTAALDDDQNVDEGFFDCPNSPTEEEDALPMYTYRRASERYGTPNQYRFLKMSERGSASAFRGLDGEQIGEIRKVLSRPRMRKKIGKRRREGDAYR